MTAKSCFVSWSRAFTSPFSGFTRPPMITPWSSMLKWPEGEWRLRWKSLELRRWWSKLSQHERLALARTPAWLCEGPKGTPKLPPFAADPNLAKIFCTTSTFSLAGEGRIISRS